MTSFKTTPDAAPFDGPAQAGEDYASVYGPADRGRPEAAAPLEGTLPRSMVRLALQLPPLHPGETISD